jgi:pantoate--beta-alanine ligase
VSIPTPEVGARRLAGGAWFAVTGDDLAAQVVRDLGGHVVQVADAHRAAYHAAACIASNHVVTVLAQAERVAAAAGVPFEAYLDLVRETVDNVASLGAPAALTGPAARGDEATLLRHLAALPASERDLYTTLKDAAAGLARRAGAGPAWVTATPPRAIVHDTIATFRKELDAARADGKAVALVPTMGALHDGHASLIRRAAAECDVVAVTIFVNPLQFAAHEDLDAYPRTLDADVDVASTAGAHLVFAPSVREMYRGPVSTSIRVTGVSEPLEGTARPGHFDGVATVVAKLFAIAGPCRAYFGEKDFQQLAVVRRMVSDLSIPVDVIGCPTVREPSGLAMSSRNAYLSDDERAAAAVLHRALEAGAAAIIDDGERDPRAVERRMASVVACEPSVALEYAAAVDPDDLSTPDRLDHDVRLLIAARVGRARLIDNIGVTV